MIKRFKNIRLRTLISFVIFTLGYPAVRAFTATEKRLLLFTDAMTIIALVLVFVGILYSFVLHGDFDVSRYYLQNGARSFRYSLARRGLPEEKKQSVDEFLREAREKREGSFNYPLFLGIVYLLLSAVLAYGFLS